MGLRAMSEKHRAIVRESARRDWADPRARAVKIAAMRLVTPDDIEAIAEALRAEPRRPHKVIAHEFDIGASTVSGLAIALGMRRQRPRRRSILRRAR